MFSRQPLGFLEGMFHSRGPDKVRLEGWSHPRVKVEDSMASNTDPSAKDTTLFLKNYGIG